MFKSMFDKQSILENKDQATLNCLVGELFVEVLVRLGLDLVVTAPGSRSTPITLASARNDKVKCLSILDERSAAFYALGAAKATGKPVLLVCTSGTAAANFFPAVIEAKMSSVPLIVVSCDRPFELHDRSAEQTIDQLRLFGNYAVGFYEFGLPEASASYADYLRQSLVHAFSQSLGIVRGPVHINLPFRDPVYVSGMDISDADRSEFFSQFATVIGKISECSQASLSVDALLLEKLASHKKGLILVGNAQELSHQESAIESLSEISNKLAWPIVADVLNPLRNHQNKFHHLITGYDWFLRSEKRSKDLQPKAVLQVGALPTSKDLRKWLKGAEAFHFILGNGLENKDPLNALSVPLRGTLDSLAFQLKSSTPDGNWLSAWSEADEGTQNQLEDKLKEFDIDFEGAIAHTLSKSLAEGSQVCLANSMSVRYAELLWKKNDSQTRVFCNRGANGIDGTVSTALGIAETGKPSVLLTGDLAFLHDSNALLNAGNHRLDLTILLVNNQGGGIFEHLPIASDAHFENYFATPQAVDYSSLCAALSVPYQQISSRQALDKALNSISGQGIRVFEIKTDRKKDVKTLHMIRSLFTDNT